MPESKRRKPKCPPPNRAMPRKRVLPQGGVAEDPPAPRPERNRGPVREIPEELRPELPVLPEPASYDQVLVAMTELDPLGQELLLAERLAWLPNPNPDGPPVTVPRNARPGWAHQLRQLGVFVIPELATHQVVATEHGIPTSLKQITRQDIWEKAKAQDPSLGELVDGATTPEARKRAARILLARLPVAQQIAMSKLMEHAPADLEPT